MGYLSKEASLTVLFVLTIGIFFAEIIAGYASGSIALIADSFHMLSDVIAIFVAGYSMRLAKMTSFDPQYTYGLQRSEVLGKGIVIKGALINAISLLTLCFTIGVEAIQRFFNPSEIKNPYMVLIVGICGLVVNAIGLFLFHEHAHNHGSHSHALPSVSEAQTQITDLEVGHPVASRQKIIQMGKFPADP